MPEETVAEQAVDIAYSLAVIAGVVAGALLLYVATVRVAFRLSRTDTFAVEATRRVRWPARLTVVLVAIMFALRITELPAEATGRATRVLGVAAILTGTWAMLRLAVAVEATLLAGLHWDEGEEGSGSAWARARTTKIILLRRVASGLLIVVAIGGVLLTFDTARSLGTSLLASAGIIGVIAGIAAQPTLGNLVAGIQLAVAEPFRIDDVVVVEGEWGNIEEITLTYVVIRIWDRRRLVLPTSYFVHTPFHNWTRHGTQVIGQVSWHLDHRTPVEALRQEFHRQVDAHPLWDGDVAALQVVEVGERTIHVRGVVTAPNAGKVWDLRCAIREGVLGWLVHTHPEALPQTRVLEGAPLPPDVAAPSDPTPVSSPTPETAPAPDPTRTGEWPAKGP